MAYQTRNYHSARFVMRKMLRRLRDSLDNAIESLFADKRRKTV